MISIQEYLRARKTEVDRALERYLSEDRDYPESLFRAMEYSVKAGGKRVRPILVLAAAEAVAGGTGSRGELSSALLPALPVACAFEIIHTFSLVHDDLPAMDNADLRRGVPTSHKIFGEAMAVLAGDGLLAEAFYLLCHPDFTGHVSPKIVLEVIREIAAATGARGMVGGQVLDLEGEGKKSDLEALAKIHAFKTGALISASVTCGARVVGATTGQLDHLKEYGNHLGLAFQIADDILDVSSSTEELGKTRGDVGNQKSTYPALLGLEGAKQKAKAAMENALAALKSFGASADPLREIAKYVVERKH